MLTLLRHHDRLSTATMLLITDQIGHAKPILTNNIQPFPCHLRIVFTLSSSSLPQRSMASPSRRLLNATKTGRSAKPVRSRVWRRSLAGDSQRQQRDGLKHHDVFGYDRGEDQQSSAGKIFITTLGVRALCNAVASCCSL